MWFLRENYYVDLFHFAWPATDPFHEVRLGTPRGVAGPLTFDNTRCGDPSVILNSSLGVACKGSVHTGLAEVGSTHDLWHGGAMLSEHPNLFDGLG